MRMRMRVRLFLVLGGVLTVLLTSTALAVVTETTAQATASTGYIYELTTGPYGSTYIDNCVDSVIANVAQNRAYIESNTDPHRCNTSYAYNMPGGYIGANADGYINGSYCGSTGFYYNSGPASGFGVGAQLCSNPAGSQVFDTVATETIWDYVYSTWQYVYTNSLTSPNQNY